MDRTNSIDVKSDDVFSYTPEFNKGRLYVDLTPESCVKKTARAYLDINQYSTIRFDILNRFKNTCQYCNRQYVDSNLFVCERFSYDMEKHVRKLEYLTLMCWNCKDATHLLASCNLTYDTALENIKILEYGDYMTTDRFSILMSHLQRVVKLTDTELVAHLKQALEDYAIRSTIDWQLNIQWLVQYQYYQQHNK